MLFRFCLYGFLKNQRYFEPFLILIFLDKGLSFFSIGLLVAVREVTVNLFEVLSGVVADLYGRRRAMVFSFSSYLVSFAILGLAQHPAILAVGMALFGLGDAFRSGTHKAMILTWLRLEGRLDEKISIYGLTRSWSQIGSAVSVTLAAVFVLLWRSYQIIFFVAMLPYLADLVNLATYPKELDRSPQSETGDESGLWQAWVRITSHLKETLCSVMHRGQLRRVMAEAMGFEGIVKASKDYLQPVLKAAALQLGASVALARGLGEHARVALLVGPVYFALYLLSAVASRQAGRLAKQRTEEDAADLLWLTLLGLFVGLAVAMWFGSPPTMIVALAALVVLQNLWRPVLISRFFAHSSEDQAATILSVEGQGKALATMLLAPLLGWLVDRAALFHVGARSPFWPVAVVGFFVAGSFVVARRVWHR